MKKEYQKPEMQAVNIHMDSHLMEASANSVSSNGVFNSTIRSGNGVARGRDYDDWDD